MISKSPSLVGTNSLFDWVFGPALADSPYKAASVPKVDVVHSDTSVAIVADAPGYEPENIDISVENGILSITGKRTLEKEENGKTFSRRERTTESFCRSFEMDGSLDSENIKATVKNGVLQVEIPKTTKALKSKIQVVAAKG